MRFVQPLFNLLLLAGLSSGRTKVFVEIKLSLKPGLKLKVNGIPFIRTSIEQKEEKYMITVGNMYLSGYDELKFGPGEFYWDISDRQIGAVISFEKNCLTYQRDGLRMMPCASDSDFKSVLQMFDIKNIVKEYEGPDGGIYEDFNLVSKLNSSIERSFNNKTRFLMEEYP